MLRAEYQYIHFHKTKDTGKTTSWVCHNNNADDELGVVRWYGPRRQYYFLPNKFKQLIFSVKCLTDISDFIKQLSEQRKQEKEDTQESGE